MNSYQKSSFADLERFASLMGLWSFRLIRGCCYQIRPKLLDQTSSPWQQRGGKTRQVHGQSSTQESLVLQGSPGQPCDSNLATHKFGWEHQEGFAESAAWFQNADRPVLQPGLLTLEKEALIEYLVKTLRGADLIAGHVVWYHLARRRPQNCSHCYRLQFSLRNQQGASFGPWLSSVWI